MSEARLKDMYNIMYNRHMSHIHEFIIQVTYTENCQLQDTGVEDTFKVCRGNSVLYPH